MLVKEDHIWDYNWKNEITSVIKAVYIAEVKNPKLSDFQLGKCLPAEKCFLAIYDFLSREKPVVDNRTDIQKITGKGFDKQYGFRTRPHATKRAK